MPEGPLPETTVGIPYSASLQASGGKGTLTHSATGLPKGLEISGADGAISGTATEAGDFTVTLTVTDQAKQSKSKDFSLVVAPAPAFTTTSLPGATAASDYLATIEVTGGKAPLTLSLSDGELPDGLSFNPATATISGAPGAEGEYTFSLKVVDAHGAEATQDFTLAVAPPLEVLTTSLPNGNVGVAYSQTLKAQGGKAPLTWEVAEGLLPDGLSLEAATGKVSGTPTSGGPFQVTFLVRDANGASRPLEIDAKIFGNAPPQIATSSLPNAVVGVAYSQNLVASEGAPPYTWTISSGMLPAGLTLSAAGVISGAATTPGPQSFQVTLTDANGQTAQKALTLTAYPELVISTASLPESYTGQAYNLSLSATGGAPPYTWSIAGGTLPTGLTLTSTGILSGTPTQSGSFGVTISVSDTSGQAPTKPFTLTLYDLPHLTTTSLANAVVGTNYSEPLTTSGGKPPFTFAVTAGALPAGLQLIGSTIAGTPTSAGTSTFVITATDANLKTDSKTLSLTVYQTLAITTGTLPDPYVGTTYSETLTAAGGATPYTWSLQSGALPAGLTLGANGTISGTPTTAGPATFTVLVEAANGDTATHTFNVTVRTPPSLTTASLPDGYVGQPYSLTLSASGGRTPYTFSVDQGALPAGLTLSNAGVLSGTPTAAGTATVTLAVTDANNVRGTATFTIGVFAPPTIATGSLPDGYVGSGYAQTLTSTGGKAPLTWSIVSGLLPNGISLAANMGALSGAPTATGTALFTARVTDANGKTADAPLSLAVFAPPTIASTTLPDGTLNTAYSTSLVANGGKAPLTWTVSSGALPSGLTLSPSGTISGTPTSAGTSNFALTVTDANNISAAANFSIVVYASLTVSTASPLPDAYQQVSYTQALTAAGGKAPYSWAITAGALPSGLTLSPSGTISGTPTAPVSEASFTITVTDANTLSASKAFALTVVGTPTITATTLPDGYVGLPYSATVTAQKGKLPYTFTVSSGALPAGLSLDPATGEISGAPTATGSSTFEITLTDANGLTARKTFVVGIYDAPQVTTPSPLPDAYVGSSYQATLNGSGGKTPYSWAVVSGTLPAGLALAASGDLSGTPTAPGTAAFTAQLTDSNGQVATRSYSMTVRAPLAISTATLVDGYVGSAYPTTQLSASGGKAPYTFAVTAGALPAGLTLASSGAISGTPTATGASTFSVTVTDANGVTATRSLGVTIYAAPTITTASALPDAYAATAYSHALTTTGGKAPLTFTISAGALPAGLTLSTGGTIAGTTSATGTFNVTVTVTDDNGVSGTRAFTLAVLPTLQITTTALDDGYVGDAYAATVAATGGKPPYSFAVTAGMLPAGLTLTGATLSGTPTAPTSAPFTLTVTDANGKTASQALTANIYAPPQVSTSTLTDAYVGTAYSATLAANGGKSPMTWAVSSGALPQGVSLSASGALSGTPTTTGTANFTVALTDANGKTAQKALTIAVLPALSITTAALPDAYTGSAYTAALTASGGKSPYTFALQAGTLPNGLSLSGAGAFSGTPTATGTASLTFSVTDANGVSATRALTLAVLAPPSITTTTLADGYPSSPYTDALTATGGRAPYTFSVASGLPPGVTLSSSGQFGGAPTTAGNYPFTVTVTDDNGKTGTKSLTITVRSALVIGTASLADGYVGDAYSATLSASGGKTPYTWSISSGALPTGITLAASTGVLSGTPGAASTSSFTVRVTDGNGVSTDKPLSLAIYAKPAVSTASPLPDAYVGSAYNQTLAATGGKAPLTWSISSGTLPNGLTLSPAGVLSGTATTNGTATFTVRVTDANGQFATRSLNLTVLSGFFVTTASLPDGYVGAPYSETLTASGGLAPYSWSTTSTLPPGLTLSAAGVLSGTPTAAGSTTLNIVATDANNATTSKTLTIVVRTPPSITTASLPDAYVGSAYNQTLAGTGGATPYSWTVTPALSAGLTLSASGALSGTPTAAKASTAYTFTLTDANGVTATRTLNLTVFAAPNITVPTPPDAYVTVPWSLTPTLSGGKAPIAWSTSGTVPAWLTVNGSTGALSGTPTAAGNASFNLVATDSNGQGDTAPVAFTIYALPAITTASLPTPYRAVTYSATLTASGGKAPLTWSIASGALPTGLSLNAGAGQITGTPTASGPFTFSVQVSDANNKTATKSFTLTVPPALAITTTTLADAYRNAPYSATVAATGGLAPYSFSLSSGSLPDGLTLNASTGAISGTVGATAVTQSFVVLVTDANGTTASRSLGITALAPPDITTASLPDAYKGEAYSQTVATSGGKAPFNYSVSAGALPVGVTLDAANGTLSGTPTATGTFNFTVTVSDANGKTDSQALTLGVYAPPAIASTTFPPGYAGNAYSKTLSATGGKAPLTWSITQGALPPGLTIDSATGSVGTAISGSGITNGQSFSFTVSVVDANAKVGTAAFSMVVQLPPAITTTALTPGTEGITYMKAPGVSEQLTAENGKAPYTWTITGLPPGLSASSTTGVISGIPAQGSAGSHTVQVSLTDANGFPASGGPFTLDVVTPTPIPGGGTHSVAPIGSPITDQVTVFVMTTDNRPKAGIGVRLRKNGVEFSPVKEALTDANGKAWFSGLGLNGTTDTLDITVNGADITNVTLAQVNAALVTIPVEFYPLPGVRYEPSGAWDAVNNRLVVFGGAVWMLGPTINTQGCVDNTLALTPTGAVWSEDVAPGLLNNPPARYGAAMTAFNGRILLVGGLHCTAGTPLSDAWIYNPGTHTWTSTAPLPTGRSDAALAMTSGGSAMLIGGSNSGGPTNEVWEFDGTSWFLLGFLPGAPRAKAAAVYRSAAEETWVCGGMSSVPLSGCYSRSLFTGWIPGGNLPAAREGLAMAYDPASDRIYAFGGRDSAGQPTNTLFRYAGGIWSTVSPVGTAPPARADHVMAWDAAKSRLVVYGGNGANFESLSDVWTYDPATNAWTRQDPPPPPAPTTYTISGAITGGYPPAPGEVSMAMITVTTSSGKVLSGGGSLSATGSGSYSISGIPEGDVVTLVAVNRTLGPPPPLDFYSIVDLGTLGPVTGNITQNIAFPPGPMTRITSSGTYSVPADWGIPTPPYEPQMSAITSRPGFPINAANNGNGILQPNGWTFTASYLPVASGTSQDLFINGRDNGPLACEVSTAFMFDISAGPVGALALEGGARNRSPGQPECTSFGTGYAQMFMIGSSGDLKRAAAADMDGDGDEDLLLASINSEIWYFKTAAGTVSGQPSIILPAPPAGLTTLDYNQDGRMDFAVTHNTAGANHVVVYGQNPNGTFSQLDSASLTSPSDVVSGDFNGDGWPDLAVAQPLANQVTVYINDPVFGLNWSPFNFTFFGVRGLEAKDLDADGFDDLVVTESSSNRILAYQGKASGFSLLTTVSFGPGASPYDVAVADLDSDGDQDIAVALNQSDQVAIVTQGPAGTFSVFNYMPAPLDPTRVEITDVVGNAYPEIVVTGSGQTMVMTAQAGSPAWYVGSSAQDAVSLDFDQDGAEDLVVLETSGPARGYKQLRPVPLASDATFELTAPSGVGMVQIRRGAFPSTVDWVYYGPATAGANAISLPLPSTLAPSRSAPVGQSAAWQPTLYFDSVGAPIDLNELTFRLMRPRAVVQSGGIRYIRQ
ncbi:MAG: putative Ig domain-containing protein [Myxococcaceae bacterium]|nr:putative Ig domain-containing protein [Myxococcaceae bacterium]